MQNTNIEINPNTKSQLTDLDFREITTLLPLVVLVFFIGPQPGVLLSYMHVSVEHLLEQLHNALHPESVLFKESIESIAQYIKALFKWV